jgi:chromosomal replication initiator protein
MELDFQSLWNNCLAIIRDIVPEAAYNTWFKPIKPLSYKDGKVTIQVPTQFFYEYLEEKFAGVLKMTLSRVFGKNTLLNYRVVVGEHRDVTVDYPTDGRTLPAGSEPVDLRKTPQLQTRVAPQDLDSQLNSRYTFQNFYEGRSNKLALRTGKSVSENPGKTAFNPHFIYGPSGVGKTHLCHAVGLRIRELFPEKKVLYVSANLFQIQYTDAVRKNTTNDFLNFYQSLDVLILDDIHELIGKQQTQNTFFHIFNNLHQLGKQLVMTSDKAPVEMQGMEERLITRLKWGLTTEIVRPDMELRKKILQKKIEAEGLVIREDVFDYIAEHVTENVRDIEGTLVSLMAHSVIHNREIDIQLVQQVISKTVHAPSRKQLTIEGIQARVCNFFQLDRDVVLSTSRKQEIVQVRQIIMYLAKKHTHSSYAHIGKMVGNKDHATVVHSCKAVKNQLDISKTFRSTMALIEDVLKTVA